MNVVNLIGRLIADPEIKKTQNGISLCTFTISVQRPGGAKATLFAVKPGEIRRILYRDISTKAT